MARCACLRGVVVEGVHAAVALRIPQLDGLVVAAGGDEPAVRRELGAAHLVRVRVRVRARVRVRVRVRVRLSGESSAQRTQLEWPESEY